MGVDQKGHVGRFLHEGGSEQGHDVAIVDSAKASGGNKLLQKILWRFDHRPNFLREFSSSVVDRATEFQPDIIVSTGMAPILAGSLEQLKKKGYRLVNYSTDDPWKPAHKARWFLEGLLNYDVVFSTRRANIQEFQTMGCNNVEWLPFAYDLKTHFPEKNPGKEWISDIAFVGGADFDRVPILEKLISEGFNVSLWGGYWDRYKRTKGIAKGFADSDTLRKVISGTKCALTVVRRANRDGHAMRSFEVAAIGAPMLVEDTSEHRELFGTEGEAVRYFCSDKEMMDRARWFVDHWQEGREMSSTVRKRITAGQNTYADRFDVMVQHVI